MRLLPPVIRRFRQGTGANAHQVVDQRQPVAGRERSHLVDAVGIEGGERGLGWLVAAQIDDRLLGIAVRHEEGPGVVDQEFVELRLDRPGHGQPHARPFDHRWVSSSLIAIN